MVGEVARCHLAYTRMSARRRRMRHGLKSTVVEQIGRIRARKLATTMRVVRLATAVGVVGLMGRSIWHDVAGIVPTPALHGPTTAGGKTTAGVVNEDCNLLATVTATCSASGGVSWPN